MGHYASEMQCDTCGHIYCICERFPDTRLDWYVVDYGFTVCTAEQFLIRHSDDVFARMRLASMIRYEDRHEAETAARIQCEQAVEATRTRLSELKNICKVQRPWEKK